MNRKQFLTRTLLTTTALASLLASGCGRSGTPLAVEVGFDITPPDVDNRAKRASQFVKYLRPGDEVTVRALDSATTILATAAPHTDQDAYRILTDAAGRMTPVTNLPRYFEAILPALEAGRLPALMVVYTDGLTDAFGASECEERVRAVATRLAKVERLQSVLLVGTVRENRPGWGGLPEMLDALKEKLIVYPRAMIDPAQITRKIRAIRASAVPDTEKGG